MRDKTYSFHFSFTQAVAGSGVGGFALSPLTSFLINTMGWRWALRITGLGGGALVIVCAFSFIQRFPSARRGVDFSLFKDPTFLGLFMMAAIVCFGYFSPFFYLPSYAVYNGLSSQQGSLIAGLLNLGSGIGRIFWGFTADRTFGLMNSLCICLSVASLSVLLMWPFVHDFAGIAIFGIIYGSFVGGFISLLPTLIASSFSKRGNLATVIGMVYSGFFFGNLFGTPIAGSLLDRNTVVSPVDGSKTSNYLPSILLAGFIIMLGSLIMISVRIRRSNILFKRV